jgi:hypothetical protein
MRRIALLLLVMLASVSLVPAPVQPPDEEEGNGCGWSGHINVVPNNVIDYNGDCQDVAHAVGTWPYYPDQRILWASNSTVTTACPGRDVWIDLRVTRFNVDGVQEIIGTITYDADDLTFFGYQATEDYTFWSSVVETSPGVLSVYLTANVNATSPGDYHYVAARILFRANAPLQLPTRVGIGDLHAYSSNPNPPYHQIPMWEVCKRDSDLILAVP